MTLNAPFPTPSFRRQSGKGRQATTYWPRHLVVIGRHRELSWPTRRCPRVVLSCEGCPIGSYCYRCRYRMAKVSHRPRPSVQCRRYRALAVGHLQRALQTFDHRLESRPDYEREWSWPEHLNKTKIDRADLFHRPASVRTDVRPVAPKLGIRRPLASDSKGVLTFGPSERIGPSMTGISPSSNRANFR